MMESKIGYDSGEVDVEFKGDKLLIKKRGSADEFLSGDITLDMADSRFPY